jgi:cell wall-associated NlpC family hydrolase
LGKGLDLLFSSDPAQYLADAGALDMVTRKFAQQLREFAVKKQNVEATQLVVADRTSLLKAERVKLNRQVAAAKEDLAKAQRILNNLKKEDRERLARLEAERENKILNESKKYAQSYKGDNTRGSIALKYALAQVGDVYVWAAAGPTRWDCSGLTMRSFQKAGVSLPHSSRIQIKYGKNISASSLKPGDLLFFGKPISHVSMYMGGGKMVQAPRPGKKVEVVNFTKMFGKKPFVGARRL